MKETIEQRLRENLARVRNLLEIYETHLMGAGRGRRGHLQTDVLRAATVMLHASLEDFLRSLAYWKLPAAGKEVIDTIPIVGSEGHAKKFLLGELVQHKGKTVDDVIAESVHQHLERANYNNADEICSFLSSIGVTPAEVSGNLPELERLMWRRHQIVHRADRDETGGRGMHRIRSMGRRQVRTWADAVESFAGEVLARV